MALSIKKGICWYLHQKCRSDDLDSVTEKLASLASGERVFNNVTHGQTCKTFGGGERYMTSPNPRQGRTLLAEITGKGGTFLLL